MTPEDWNHAIVLRRLVLVVGPLLALLGFKAMIYFDWFGMRGG